MSIGSWFGGDERREGDWKSWALGSKGIEGYPNVGRIAEDRQYTMTPF